MADIKSWDPIDGNNTADPPDGFPEGQPAKSLNDASRAVMGGVRRQWEDKEWFNFGHTITYQDAVTFLALGNQSATYKVGRRCRCVGTNTGTVYGTISNVAAVTDTTVTLTMDSGQILVTEVDGSEAVSVGSDPGTQSIAYTSVADPPAQPETFSPGMIMIYGAVGPPNGWLICNGQAVNRTTYADLFTAIGTTYGSGDGSTTFNIPDLVGRAPIGYGQSPDAGEGGGAGTSRGIGTKAGAETHTLSTDQMPAHDHTSPFSATGPQEDGGGSATNIPVPGTGPATGSAGNGVAHNNVGPALTIQYIIKF